MHHDQISMFTLPSSRRQSRLVYALAILSIGIFVITWNFSKIKLPVIEPFLPSYVALVCFIELITAYILWNQYRLSRQFPILMLMLTYCFSSLVVIPHILTFPGVFHPQGLLGAGNQTAVYFWAFWHGLYPVGFILYFTSQHRKWNPSRVWRNILVPGTLLFIGGLIAGYLLLTTRFHHLLPTIIQNGDYEGLFTTGIGPLVILFNITAVCMALMKKNKSVMDTLIFLTMLTFCIDVFLTLGASARYTLGWYVARIISLFSSSIVLLAFTHELSQLNKRMMKSNHKLEQQFHTIMEQKHQLEKSEDNYRQVVNSIHEVIFQMNTDGFIHYTNRYWKELFCAEVPTGPFSLRDYIHPDDVMMFHHALESMVERKSLQERELRWKTSDGSVIWLHMSMVPMKDPLGGVIGAHGTLREITAQMREREIEKYRVLGQLATAICHEVRNPLTAVRGFTQVLGKYEYPQNMQYVPIILGELDIAEKALTEYLEFSRPRIDHDSCVSLNDIISTCINELQEDAASHQVQILEQIDSDIGFKTDRRKVERVVTNIIRNGIEAMPGGGELVVIGARRQDAIQIIVQDFGKGMSGDEIKRLGEPTYFLGSNGTGFGMMIAKQYVLAMNGEITFESRKEQGTKVIVSLPQAL